MQREDEIVVIISAIEHYAYCPRQFALMHIECTYEDNAYTLHGTHVHTRVDEANTRFEPGKRIETALPIWCHRLGIQGKADCIEFYDDGSICPVEYKRSRRGKYIYHDLQLCAQALCLEEMMGIPISRGSVYYHGSHRCRYVDLLDADLRAETEKAIAEIRQLISDGETPAALNDERCENCSLIDLCDPALVTQASRRDSQSYLFHLEDEET